MIVNIKNGKSATGTSSQSSETLQETVKEHNPYQNVDNTIEAINLKLEE